MRGEAMRKLILQTGQIRLQPSIGLAGETIVSKSAESHWIWDASMTSKINNTYFSPAVSDLPGPEKMQIYANKYTHYNT